MVVLLVGVAAVLLFWAGELDSALLMAAAVAVLVLGMLVEEGRI